MSYIPAMKINQVLVVYKQLSSEPSAKEKHTEGQEQHLKTLDIIYPLLRRYGISFRTCSTKQLQTVKEADLVITIGGDGTVLTASHFVQDQPILGIKSFGKESIGYFCAAEATTINLYLQSLLSGHIKPIKLNRLEVSLDGHRVRELALNDILFAHAIPASTTKYRLSIRGKSETQKSSGIWVSSAAGSTAAVSAAGGRPLPLKSKKMEYIVREPYAPSSHYTLTGGILQPSESIKIISLSTHGAIYIDGSHIQYPAPPGTKITISSSKKPLKIFWKK